MHIVELIVSLAMKSLHHDVLSLVNDLQNTILTNE